SPSGAPPGPTTAYPRPAWKTASERGTSDGFLVARLRRAPRSFRCSPSARSAGLLGYGSAEPPFASVGGSGGASAPHAPRRAARHPFVVLVGAHPPASGDGL